MKLFLWLFEEQNLPALTGRGWALRPLKLTGENFWKTKLTQEFGEKGVHDANLREVTWTQTLCPLESSRFPPGVCLFSFLNEIRPDFCLTLCCSE